MLKAKPILFQEHSINAMRREVDPKTQTRRVIKPQPMLIEKPVSIGDDRPPITCDWNGSLWHDVKHIVKKAKYKPGDIMWVRETWNCIRTGNGRTVPHHTEYWFKADEPDYNPDNKWRPSIFMPREACRIWLLCTAVKAERLQDISEEDSRAEGCTVWDGYTRPDRRETFDSCRDAYHALWDDINAAPKPVYEGKKIVGYVSYPWEDIRKVTVFRGLPWEIIGNPWVFAYTFKKTGRPEGWPGKEN